MKVFCVIPAYNEDKNVKLVLLQVMPLVDRVVLVDDGSSDNTYSIAKSCGAISLRHLINRGQGAALRTGSHYALAAGADVVVHFDADNQFLSSDIKEVVRPILTGQAEAVFGSRFLVKRSVENLPKTKRLFILPLARLANRLLLGVNLSDPQSGFRAFSRPALERIGWQQDDMAHCSEILFAVRQAGLKTVEVPITVIYHHFGQRFTRGFKIIKDLIIGTILRS